MLAGLGVEGDIGRAGLGEVRDDPVDRPHHEMHVDVGLDAVLAQRLADQRADGEIRDVVIVHDIEVHDVGAGLQDLVDLLAEPGEIRRQDGRGNLEISHGVDLNNLVRRRALYLNRPKFSAVSRQEIGVREGFSSAPVFVQTL
jgi:hypothetical protein